MRIVFRIHERSASTVATELTVHDYSNLVSAIRAAHDVLKPGEEATEPLEPLQAVVSTCRSHGYWLFIDLLVAGERIQAVVEPAVLQQHGAWAPSGLALSLVTRPGSTVRVHGRPGRTRRGELSVFASTLELVGLPPEPAAVAKAAQLVMCGDLDAAVAASALGCERPSFDAVVHALEAAGGDDQESMCRQAVRSCAASLCAGQHRRHRPQHFAKAQLDALRSLHEEHATWRPVAETELFPWDEASLGELDPERGLPSGLPAAEREVRCRYIRNKKVPQLRWMLRQVGAVLRQRNAAATGGGGAPATRLLDLGCGRADFSLMVARCFPMLQVLGLDTNPAAIDTARQRAAAAALPNARFAVGDAAEWLGAAAADSSPPNVDVVTALHACGGLSDIALEFAAVCGASAVVCTCCFNKHRALWPAERWQVSDADKDLICRVAGSEQLEVASIARETISGLRLAAATRSLSRRSGSTAAGHATLRSMLKTFPAAYSPQNFVLVLEVPPQEALVGSSTAADGSAAVVTDPDGYVELRSLARSCGPESTATAASVCLPCV